MRTRQRVERAERLVEQEDPRAHGEGAGDPHALLHPARDFRGTFVGVRLHADEGEGSPRPAVTLGARHGSPDRAVDRQADILVDRQPRQEGVVLEHHRTVGPGFVDLAPGEEDAAFGRTQEPRHDVEEGRLAAARMADDGDELALVDLEVDPPEHVGRTGRETERDPADLEEGAFHGAFPAHCSLVPRVTARPTRAVSRSRRKPTSPM